MPSQKCSNTPTRSRLPIRPDDNYYRARARLGEPLAETNPEVVKTIGGSHGEISLYDNGVILFTSDEGLYINSDVVRRTDGEFRQLAGGAYVTVLDFRPAAFASREARDYAALATKNVALATALVFNQEIGQWLANQWTQRSQPQRPVAFFADLPPALAWASEKAAELLGTA